MLRFAYSTINWGTKPDLAVMFADIASAGWEAVELFDHALDWLGTPDRLNALLGGLQVATFFGAVELPIDPNQMQIHKQRIDYAALFGAEMYGLVGGSRLRWRPPTSDEYKSLATACEDLAIYSADKGVGIGYHPHVGCTIETEAEIDLLLNETQRMGLCLDVSHIALVGEDPVAHLRKYATRTGYLHMKDWAAGKFVEMGRGSIGIDFPTIFAELDAQQFSGWIVIEQSRSDVSPLDSAQINARYVTDLGYALRLPESAAS